MSTRWVRHIRINLAVHELRAGGDRPLLLLHGLGERTPSKPPNYVSDWPGSVWGLDFTGHGDSDVPSGGGYTCEVLMGDTDAVLAELGPATILGRGLGAYVGLLIAGARPHMVRGVILCDGPGLAAAAPARPRRCSWVWATVRWFRPTRSHSPSSLATCARLTTRPRSLAKP